MRKTININKWFTCSIIINDIKIVILYYNFKYCSHSTLSTYLSITKVNKNNMFVNFINEMY